MKIQYFYSIICLAILAFLLGMTGCEYDGPTAVWNPDADLGEQPVITAINPPESAGSASVIQIIGEGFKADSTQVYFSDVLAIIKSITSTEIEVYRPNISGDSIVIHVEVAGSVSMATYSGYDMPTVVRNYGKFITRGETYMMEFDAEGNMWAMIRRRIYKILPDEIVQDYAALGFRGLASDIKAGPNGNLFMQKENSALLYMFIPAQNDTTVEHGEFPVNINFIDIDQHGNIYGGGDKVGIGVLSGDQSFVTGNCEDINVVCLRVFDNALYVLDDESNVWRCEILDEAGNLGDKELYVDWSASGYAGTESFYFTFDADGILYIGTDNTDAVLMFDTGGQLIGPLLKGVLFPNAIWLTWDNGNNLYIISQDTPEGIEDDLFQINMGKPGAPYYGRGL